MRARDLTTPSAREFSPRLLVIPVLSTGFGAVSGAAIDASLPIAGFGLVWGVGAMLVATRLARRGDGSPVWSQAPLYLALALAFMSLGGGIATDLASPDMQSEFEITRVPAFGLYFAAIHMAFEWLLLPAALMLNWNDRARRYLLLAAAISFYVMRMVSALYFAPTAMEWSALPADTVLSGSLLSEVEQWTTLNKLVRGFFQEWLVTALLIVAMLRGRGVRA